MALQHRERCKRQNGENIVSLYGPQPLQTVDRYNKDGAQRRTALEKNVVTCVMVRNRRRDISLRILGSAGLGRDGAGQKA